MAYTEKMEEEHTTPPSVRLAGSSGEGGGSGGVRPGSPRVRATFIGAVRPMPNAHRFSGGAPPGSSGPIVGEMAGTAAAATAFVGQENDKKRKGILNKWISSREPTPFPRLRSASESVVGFQRSTLSSAARPGEDSRGEGDAPGGLSGSPLSGVDRRSYSTSAVPGMTDGLPFGVTMPTVVNGPTPSSPHHNSMRRAILGSKGKERMNFTDTFDMLFKKKPKAESTSALPLIPSLCNQTTPSHFVPAFAPAPMSQNGCITSPTYENGEGTLTLHGGGEGSHGASSYPPVFHSPTAPLRRLTTIFFFFLR